MKKLLAVMALMVGFSSAAHAGIMIEPYLGYEIGKFTDADGKSTGVTVGGRLAYKAPLFLWLGLDGSFGSSGKYKPDSGSDADMKHTSLYGVVGFDFPILFRVWAGYGFSDQFALDTPYNSTFKGKNYKLGASFTGLPFICLNAEYIKGTTDEISGGTLANSSPSTKFESVMLSVSLPLTF